MLNKTYGEYFVNLDGLDPLNTVVRCITADEARVMTQYLASQGVWDAESANVLYDNWDMYEESTCYHLSHSEWCYDSWFEKERPQYRIVDFSDIFSKVAWNQSAKVTMSYDNLFG